MSKSIYKLLDTETKVLVEANDPAANRQIEVICSTESADRIGDVIVQSGINTDRYVKNPVVLWGHDSNLPVARAVKVFMQDGSLHAVAEFPPEGEDADSDWVFGKIKNKLVNAVSIGFIPKEWEPVDAKSPWDGYKFTASEMVEFSFCSVPMNAEAMIVGRSLVPAKTDLLPTTRRLLDGFGLTLSTEEARTMATKTVVEAEPEPVDPDQELSDTLTRIVTDLVEVKAGRKLSGANEAKLRAAHGSIGDVLAQMPVSEEPDADDGSKLAEAVVRPRRAEMEGRSETARFPQRVRREVDLLKMRRELQPA